MIPLTLTLGEVTQPHPPPHSGLPPLWCRSSRSAASSSGCRTRRTARARADMPRRCPTATRRRSRCAYCSRESSAPASIAHALHLLTNPLRACMLLACCISFLTTVCLHAYARVLHGAGDADGAMRRRGRDHHDGPHPQPPRARAGQGGDHRAGTCSCPSTKSTARAHTPLQASTTPRPCHVLLPPLSLPDPPRACNRCDRGR